MSAIPDPKFNSLLMTRPGKKGCKFPFDKRPRCKLTSKKEQLHGFLTSPTSTQMIIT